MKTEIIVYHPKTNAIVWQTVTTDIMLFVDKLTPYDEAGYPIIFNKVEEAAE
jgi:hypothetical protein